MIIYFSGTGNSRYAATLLSRHFGDPHLMHLNAALIAKGEVELPERVEKVVWVCPVYAWGLPPVVSKFMSRVKFNRSVPHYLVVTCGDDTGNIDREWRRLMNNRGIEARGCWSVVMPNVYVTFPGFDTDSSEVATGKLEAVPARIAEIAAGIKQQSSTTDIVRGRFAGLKSGLIRNFFRRNMMSAKPFRSTDACVGCGVCSRVCPMDNITMTDGHPQWSDDCAFCLACYHHCPTHAVAYGNSTRKKGQYICPE
ncbi:MAG: EFR1 family ferrodoxin [Muribaculaceae bacterium]|nr:EFR1 family ferrodoxin [Muribaculaceae bacterium]